MVSFVPALLLLLEKPRGQILLNESYTLDRKDSVLYMRFILLEVLIPLDDEYFFTCIIISLLTLHHLLLTVLA